MAGKLGMTGQLGGRRNGAKKNLSSEQVKTTVKLGRHAFGNNLVLYVSKTNAGNISRRWCFRYNIGGRDRVKGLGSALDVSVPEARKLADACRSQLSRGEDPLDADKAAVLAARPALTFYQYADDWIQTHARDWRPGRSAGYGYAYKFYREFKRLGKNFNGMLLKDITTREVKEAILPIWKSYRSAKTTLSKLERVLDAAKAEGLIDDNPAMWKNRMENLLPKPLPHVNNPSMPYKDVPAFVLRVRDETYHVSAEDRYLQRQDDSVQRHNPVAAQALELIILTATRQQEAVGTRWSEIDFAASLWTLPPERMKENRMHFIPLSRQAAALLRKMEAIKCSDFVFPGQNRRSAAAKSINGGAPLAVMRNLGITPQVSNVHGLRSSFSEWAYDTGKYVEEVVESCLSHAVGNLVRRDYRRGLPLDEMRKCFQEWADLVAPDGK